MDFKTVNIFISSSFNDMHAERDYLVEYVFPELREWCEKRRLYLNDIDLRWGVSTADSDSHNTIRVCLNRIDECRPFFLCFLGQRRGTVFGKEYISEESFEEYPELKEMGDIYSATELEIEHALLSPMLKIINHREFRPEKAKRALFFLRENPFDRLTLSEAHQKIYTNAAAKDPLEAERKHNEFRELIRKKCKNVTDYQCRFDTEKITPELKSYGCDPSSGYSPHAEQGRLTDFSAENEELKEVVIRRLKEMILEEYPDRKYETDDPALTEADLQMLTKARFTQFFIRREGAFDGLRQYLSSSSSSVFVLSAQSGAGKSTLLSNFANEVKDRNVIIRFCGISPNSVRFTDVLRSVFEEAAIALPIDDRSFLSDIGVFFRSLSDQGRYLIILDDITKTSEGASALELLPKDLPDHIKLIASVRETDETKAFVAAMQHTHHAVTARIAAFDSKDKRRLIDDFLSKNLKALDEKHIDYLCSMRYTDNPLYMKIILKELRTFGVYEELLREIESFGKSPEDAFSHLLERLEQKVYDSFTDISGAAGYLFGLLGYARTGIRKSDIRTLMLRQYQKPCNECIEYILKCPRDYLSGVVFTDADAKVDFLYDSFKRASQRRYSKNEIQLRNDLAAVFEYSDPEECSYQLRMADNPERLKELYADPAFITRFCTINGGWKLMREVDLLPEGIVSGELSQCVHICAQALTNHPDKAPQILYKEITDPVFRQKARKLIHGTWLRFEPILQSQDTADPIEEDTELAPYLENKYKIDSHVSVKCFATDADLAFMILKVGEVTVFRMSTAENIGSFKINSDNPNKLLASADGKLFSFVDSEMEIHIFELIQNGKDFFLKPVCRDECAKIRFKGPCAYAVTDAVVWQTLSGEIKTFQDDSVRSLGEYDGRLEGAWCFDKLILALRESGEHILHCDNKTLCIDAAVNDIILWNSSLYFAVKDNPVYLVDPDSFTVKEKLTADNPLYSFAVYQSFLLATDEEYCLELITGNNVVKSLGNINYSNGSVNTYAFEYIRNCKSGVYYCSDSVCAKLKLKQGEQTFAKERFFNAVKEEDRQKVYQTFEGQYKECYANGITYRVENGSTLAAYSPKNERIGSIRLDKSLSGAYILRPVGRKAAVLIVRGQKNEGTVAVTRSILTVCDGASSVFRKEYMPDDNIIGMYADGGNLWVRGSEGFSVIDTENGYAERKIPFNFTGYNINSPAVAANGTPVMFRDSTYELCVISGTSGKYLATFPLSRSIDSLERGENGVLCCAKEHGSYTYKIFLEEDE